MKDEQVEFEYKIVYTCCYADYDGRPCLFFTYSVADDGEEDEVTIVFMDDIKKLPASGLSVYVTPAENHEDS